MDEMKVSRQLMNRSYRRIKRLRTRDDLTTTDPLAAEIGLAQVDATLALAAAIRENTAEAGLLRGQVAKSGDKPGVHFYETTEQRQITSLKLQLKDLEEMVWKLQLEARARELGTATKDEGDTSYSPDPRTGGWWSRFRRGE